jgi:hypothetical protein
VTAGEQKESTYDAFSILLITFIDLAMEGLDRFHVSDVRLKRDESVGNPLLLS